MDGLTDPTDPGDEVAARIATLAAACVKCGLCLPHCPTYRLTESESESPRGRIALATLRDADADRLAHLDNCLACGACERACPSGVQFLDLIAAARAADGAAGRASLRRRVVHALMIRPRWLLALTRMARALPGAWRRRLIPDLGDPRYRPRGSRPTDERGRADPNRSADRPEIVLLSGCTGAALEPPVLAAAQVLLDRAGYRVSLGPDQCCGALAVHTGSTTVAARLGTELQHILAARAEPRCTGLVSGCAARYRALCAGPGLPVYDDPQVLLAARIDALPFTACRATVALHLPCTQQADAAAITATRRLLAAVPGLRVVELPTRGQCCGGAGSWFLDHPDQAAALAAPLLHAVRESGAVYLISANIGCRLQFARALAVPVMHPLEFLAMQLQDRG